MSQQEIQKIINDNKEDEVISSEIATARDILDAIEAFDEEPSPLISKLDQILMGMGHNPVETFIAAYVDRFNEHSTKDNVQCLRNFIYRITELSTYVPFSNMHQMLTRDLLKK